MPVVKSDYPKYVKGVLCADKEAEKALKETKPKAKKETKPKAK